MRGGLRFYFFLATLMCLLIGCKVKRPEEVIPEATMENLLYDYHLAKAMTENLPPSENYKKALYMKAVFDKYGTTEAVFDSSLVWYTRNTELLVKIYERARDRLKGESELVSDLVAKRDKKPKMTAAGDSVDVWPWERLIRVSGTSLDGTYSFTLPTDSNYLDRDTLVWEAYYRFLTPLPMDSLRRAIVALQIMYEKDTLSQWTAIERSGLQCVKLYADTLGKMKEVKGFIYYPDGIRSGRGALLAEDISMTRYHCKDSLSFAERDSLNRMAALEVDSLETAERNVGEEDTERRGEGRRLSPDEMNRRRTGARPEKKPEQVEVERHIQQERRERQMNLRRQRQMREERRGGK